VNLDGYDDYGSKEIREQAPVFTKLFFETLKSLLFSHDIGLDRKKRKEPMPSGQSETADQDYGGELKRYSGSSTNSHDEESTKLLATHFLTPASVVLGQDSLTLKWKQNTEVYVTGR
jgi:hypothetical protein